MLIMRVKDQMTKMEINNFDTLKSMPTGENF